MAINIIVTPADWASKIAPIVTAIGVCIGVLQLWNTKRQAVTLFEDALAKEYREITGTIPTAALLGELLSAELMQAHLPAFYRYFDLSNNKIFLRQIGRISKRPGCSGLTASKPILRVPRLPRVGRTLDGDPTKTFPNCGD